MSDILSYGATLGWTGADITSACVKMQAAYAKVIIPPGNYTYQGPPMTPYIDPWGAAHIAVEGAGEGMTAVGISNGLGMYQWNVALSDFCCKGIRWVYGHSPFKSTFLGSDTYDLKRILDCGFFDHTGWAVETAAQDTPYWRIRDVIVQSANGGNGFMFNGWADGIICDGIDTRGCAIGYKFNRNSGCNATIRNPIFLHMDTDVGVRAGIWVVPTPSDPGDAEPRNAGQGLRIENPRWGSESEGINATDYCVLYADEDANGLPLPTTPSTGWVRGQVVTGGAMWSSGGEALVTSTTDRLHDCEFGAGTKKYTPSEDPTLKLLSGHTPDASVILDGGSMTLTTDQAAALARIDDNANFCREQMDAPDPSWPYELNQQNQRMTWRDMTLSALRIALGQPKL